MARGGQDLISKLADRGEEAISKLAGAPGAQRFMDVATTLRDRLDEMQKRMRGLDELEARLAELEKRVDAIAGPAGTTRARGSTARKSAASKSGPSKSSASGSASGRSTERKTT